MAVAQRIVPAHYLRGERRSRTSSPCELDQGSNLAAGHPAITLQAAEPLSRMTVDGLSLLKFYLLRSERSGRDSNPRRPLRASAVFKTAAISLSATAPRGDQLSSRATFQ